VNIIKSPRLSHDFFLFPVLLHTIVLSTYSRGLDTNKVSQALSLSCISTFKRTHSVNLVEGESSSNLGDNGVDDPQTPSNPVLNVTRAITELNSVSSVILVNGNYLFRVPSKTVLNRSLRSLIASR
jgi:hypothetical protein